MYPVCYIKRDGKEDLQIVINGFTERKEKVMKKKVMKKKIVAGILIFGMAITMLTGCSSKKESGAKETETETTEQKEKEKIVLPLTVYINDIEVCIDMSMEEIENSGFELEEDSVSDVEPDGANWVFFGYGEEKQCLAMGVRNRTEQTLRADKCDGHTINVFLSENIELKLENGLKVNGSIDDVMAFYDAFYEEQGAYKIEEEGKIIYSAQEDNGSIAFGYDEETREVTDVMIISWSRLND